MFDSVKETLQAWNEKTTERAKLQHAYIGVAAGLLLVAGVVGLLNRELGQNILAVAVALAAIFLANAVVWSLLQSALLLRLPAVRRQTPRKK